MNVSGIIKKGKGADESDERTHLNQHRRRRRRRRRRMRVIGGVEMRAGDLSSNHGMDEGF